MLQVSDDVEEEEQEAVAAVTYSKDKYMSGRRRKAVEEIRHSSQRECGGAKGHTHSPQRKPRLPSVVRTFVPHS